jgi:4'-phosphopantetheinyl transferase EntD
MLAAVLPPLAVSYEMDAAAEPDPLMSGEAEAVRHAVAARRHEFALGRTCARRALAGLGLPPSPIPVGRDRAPVWPPGVVGSISHCPLRTMAVVAPATDFVAAGIDVEPNAPLPDDVVGTVARPDERRWLAGGDTPVARDRLLFSIKESVYKAWFPLTRRWLEFTDVRVDVELASASFEAQLLVDDVFVGDRLLGRMPGRFTFSPEVLATVVLLPR